MGLSCSTKRQQPVLGHRLRALLASSLHWLVNYHNSDRRALSWAVHRRRAEALFSVRGGPKRQREGSQPGLADQKPSLSISALRGRLGGLEPHAHEEWHQSRDISLKPPSPLQPPSDSGLGQFRRGSCQAVFFHFLCRNEPASCQSRHEKGALGQLLCAAPSLSKSFPETSNPGEFQKAPASLQSSRRLQVTSLWQG